MGGREGGREKGRREGPTQCSVPVPCMVTHRSITVVVSIDSLDVNGNA